MISLRIRGLKKTSSECAVAVKLLNWVGTANLVTLSLPLAFALKGGAALSHLSLPTLSELHLISECESSSDSRTDTLSLVRLLHPAVSRHYRLKALRPPTRRSSTLSPHSLLSLESRLWASSKKAQSRRSDGSPSPASRNLTSSCTASSPSYAERASSSSGSSISSDTRRRTSIASLRES